MQCIVHIGTEKTGSTSIQSAMLDQAEVLDKQGIYLARECGYPNNMLLPKSLVSKQETGDSPTRAGASPDERFDPDKVLSDTKHEINSAREKNYKTLVISSELFHSKFTRLRHAESLKTFLEDCGITQTRIIVYLRPQIDLAVSRYSTALRTGHSANEGLPLAKPDHPYFDYYSMLENWGTAFGKSAVIPKIYDKSELFSGCVAKDFLNMIDPGMANKISNKDSPRNKQLSINEQQILSAVNNTLKYLNIEEIQERKLRRKIIARLDTVAAKYNQSITLPSEFDARCFQNAFENCNKKVARLWFNRDQLFDLNYRKYQQQQEKSIPTQKELFDQFQESVVPILVEQMNEVEFMKDRRNRLKKQYNRLKSRTVEMCENIEETVTQTL